MKHPFRFSILPFLAMGAGGLGLCLRFWLFSATDEKGLLPAAHPALPMLYILTALTLGILFLATEKRDYAPFSPQLLVWWDGLGNLLGGICLILPVVTGLNIGKTTMVLLCSASCILGSVALILTGIWAMRKQRPPYWYFVLVTVAFMLVTVARCRAWGAEPQVQVYFFPLMAAIFAILTAYYRTVCAAGQNKLRLLAFFSQGCLFFSCLSLNDPYWPMHLGLLCWASAQLIPCYRRKRVA